MTVLRVTAVMMADAAMAANACGNMQAAQKQAKCAEPTSRVLDRVGMYSTNLTNREGPVTLRTLAKSSA
jgi:hypothetical protein